MGHLKFTNLELPEDMHLKTSREKELDYFAIGTYSKRPATLLGIAIVLVLYSRR